MRVRYVKTQAGPDGVIAAGATLDLSPAAARAAIAAHAAVLVDPDEYVPEAATAEARETGMLAPPDESARPRRRRE